MVCAFLHTQYSLLPVHFGTENVLQLVKSPVRRKNLETHAFEENTLQYCLVDFILPFCLM